MKRVLFFIHRMNKCSVRIVRHNIEDMINQYKFTIQEEAIIKNNFGIKTLRQIMELIPRKFNYSTFRTNCQKLGLYRDKNKNKIPVKATYNQTYFKDVNLVTCYLAGHCAADGALMFRDGKYYFSVLLKSEDECLLQNYVKELNFKGKIRHFSKKSPSSNYVGNYSSIQLSSFDNNAEYLERYYNLKPNKTKRLGPTNLNNDYFNLAYIIGMIDGDGTICSSCQSKTGFNTIQISCVSCSKPILEWMKTIFDRKFPKTLSVFSNKPREVNLCFKNDIWSFGVAGLRAAVIINYLRKFPLENYRLARKWDNPEVLAYIAEKKAQYPEYFIEPDAAELAALMPRKEEYQLPPQISLPPL